MRISFTNFIIFLSSILCSFGAEPIIVDEKNDACLFTGKYLDYVEDKSGKLTIADVSKPGFKFFSSHDADIVPNTNLSVYWIRLRIINNSKIRKNWVSELYEFRIDNYECYIPDGKGGFIKTSGGADHVFGNKNYRHKNFIEEVPLNDFKDLTFYYKIKAERPVFLIGMVRSYQRLLEYANTEYFMLALFYGVVIAMALFNLLLYFSTLDLAYFFYVLYVLSVGLFGLTQDGLGFQYLWFNLPILNNYLPQISTYFMILWAILYARSFLNTKDELPLIDKSILVILAFRTVVLILSFYSPYFASENLVNIIPLFYLYFVGIISWYAGKRVARFYVLAFTLLFLGFTLSVLNNTHIITSSPIIVYGFNIGVLCEMILLSLALADRIKILQVEKQEAQKQIIVQFKEKELLKDELTKELEAKVHERTKELENKNKELDTFVYRSSHDIKGPLKSIMGLASVGQLDVEDSKSKVYFDHILKTSSRLDYVVDHLMEVMELKESKLEITEVNFENLINNSLKKININKNLSGLETSYKIDQKVTFYSDQKLISSIIENLLDNSIKYIDCNKDKRIISIWVEVTNGKAILDISDNGLGINKHLQDKIFDMFYEVNPESSNTGIGLYKTKICVDKLEGSLDLKSEEGIGTKFIIRLKNYINFYN